MAHRFTPITWVPGSGGRPRGTAEFGEAPGPICGESTPYGHLTMGP
jgi:hypothetical protein